MSTPPVRADAAACADRDRPETCHCGRTVEPRDPDPWEGRMDGYCYDCCLNRCDCYPHECPIKHPAPSRLYRILEALGTGGMSLIFRRRP